MAPTSARMVIKMVPARRWSPSQSRALGVVASTASQVSKVARQASEATIST
ncbi:hypothetical protein D3C71_1187850 [compost metagenome]